eukprot:scaffold20865_cov150-Skeletonema_marinoi.AAC.2
MKRSNNLIADLRGPVELSRSSSFNHIHHIYRRQYTHERLLVTHCTCYRFKNAHLHCADGLRMMKRCYNLVANLRGPAELSHSSSFNQGCVKLNHVKLVGDKLHETIAALQLEEWRNDINEEIDSINQILPTVSAGEWDDDDDDEDEGGKVRAIRTWIGTTLDTINRYKADHRRVLEDATASLKLVLPLDIVTDYVLPFLELPQDPQVMEDRDYRGYR